MRIELSKHDPEEAPFGYEEELNEDRIARAEADGFTVVFPKDNELQLDLDDEDSYTRARQYLEKLTNAGITMGGFTEWRSKSGNTHMVIPMWSDRSVEERIAIQLLMGSDHKREHMNLRRVWAGLDRAMSLFRPKDAEVTTIGLVDPKAELSF